MSTIKADISVRLDIEVEAESWDVAEELIMQYIAVVSDDSRLDTSFGISDFYIHSMECDELEEQERLDLEVVLDKEASKHRKD